MTFRKSKLIDNRPSWHPLRLCVKFGSQGDQIGTENLFQPSMQTGLFDVILAKRILRAEDKSDRVCSSCGRKMKTLHQLYSFVSSALFNSENRESEKVKETRIKVVSSYPSGHVEVRCPRGKINISVIKNIALMLLRKRFINK